MVALAVPHVSVNPVQRDVSALRDAPLVRRCREIASGEPDALWAVYGSVRWANHIMASGARVVNGTKYLPVPDHLLALDPQWRSVNVWNRFAHIGLDLPARDAGEYPRFTLDSYFAYRIALQPDAPAWERIGVRYFAFTFAPPAWATAALEPVELTPVNGVWLYRRRVPDESR